MKLDTKKGVLINPICHTDIGKNNISNPKNQIYEKYKAKVKSLTEKKAEEMYMDKTFGDEYQSVFLTSNILKAVFSFASACTVFIAILWALKPLFGTILSASISIVVCALLERLKNGIWGKLSKYVLKYKEFPIIVAFAAIGLNLSSVAGSIFGAWQLPSMIEKTTAQNIELTNLDSISAHYAPLIASLDKSIELQTKMGLETTSNTTKRLTAKNVLLQTKQRSKLLESKNRDIDRAKSNNEQTLRDSKESAKIERKKAHQELYRKQINCVTTATVFELLLILCLVFNSYYLFRVEIDRIGLQNTSTDNVDSNQPDDTHTTGKESQKAHAAPVLSNNRRTIGFKPKDENRQNPENQDSDTKSQDPTDTKRHKLEYTRICALKSCEKPFLHGHNAQEYCSSKCRKKAYKNRKQNNC